MVKCLIRWLFAALFLTAGTIHLLRPDLFLPAMPPQLPAPFTLIIVSGLCELLLALFVLLPRTRSLAGRAAIALLIAVFPANIHMALHPELFPEISATLLWWRLPFQGVLIAGVWWATTPDRQRL